MINLRRRNATAAAPPPPEIASEESLRSDGSLSLGNNAKTAHRQRLAMYGGISLLAVGCMYWIMQPNAAEKARQSAADGSKTVKIATDDIVNKNVSDKEWMSVSQGQMDSQQKAIQTLQGDSAKLDDLQKRIDSLQAENSGLKSDGTQVLGAYQKENNDLKTQIDDLRGQMTRLSAGPGAMYGSNGPASYQRAGGAPTQGSAPGEPGGPAAAAAPPPRGSEIRLMSFGGDGTGGNATKVDGKAAGSKTVYSDSENYLPPNSIAPATVVVGVDATTSVKSQNDPLPVVLRITGPARSVYSPAQGKLLRTNLTGCMVNGSAIADLSSEKVYVKLQKMTCPQTNGRVAVSEVKGFISFGGKSGVRGRVVSRAGNLVGQAFIAGIFGGIGKGAATNANSYLSGSNISVNGTRQALSAGDIAMGGLGNGAGESASMVEHYLIERAEQYQPVVEMPTGINVEVVFLEGTFIRN